MTTAFSTGIHELLHNNLVRVHLPGVTKRDVLDQLVDILAGDARVRDFDAVRKAVFDREEVMSTGVGKGLALPHAKTDAVSEITAAFATTENPIPFDSVDELPVRMLFLMVSTPGEKTQNIKLLSRVSRLMNGEDFRNRLLNAENAEDVIFIFKQGERELA